MVRMRQKILSRLAFTWVVVAVTLDMIIIETIDGGIIMVEIVDKSMIKVEIVDKGKETRSVVLDNTDINVLNNGVEALGKRSKSSCIFLLGVSYWEQAMVRTLKTGFFNYTIY